MSRSRTGFTTVEILIVVLILGIIAMLVAPKLGTASDEARESALATDVNTIRSQIRLYVTQHASRLPHVDELGNVDSANFIKRLTGRTDVDGKLNPAGQMGPYLLECENHSADTPPASSGCISTSRIGLVTGRGGSMTRR